MTRIYPLTINTVLGADDLLERVVGLGTDLHGLSEAGSTSGEEHELLERELVTGVRATVDDIERRAGEDVRGLDTGEFSKVLVQGDTLLRGGSLSDGDGDTEDGVSTELALVGGAVELDQEVVDLLLLSDLELGLDKFGGNDIVDVRNGLEDTCKRVRSGVRSRGKGRESAYIPLPTYSVLTPSRSSTASWIPVEAPEGTAARKRPEKRVNMWPSSATAERTLLSEEIDLDGGVTTGVEDL